MCGEWLGSISVLSSLLRSLVLVLKFLELQSSFYFTSSLF